MSYIIDQTIFLEYIKKSIKNESLELECVFDSKSINKDTFTRILESLKSLNDFIDEETTLDIRTENNRKLSDIRVTINGLENIKTYCKTDSLEGLDNVSYMKKEFYKEDDPQDESKHILFKINNPDYDYRINIKSEILLDKFNPVIDEFLTDYSTKNKYFRYKKRYSFISYDKLFRFDLTVVKSSSKNLPKFKDSNVLGNNEIYEMEIEYIGSNIDSDGKRELERLHNILNETVDLSEEYKNPYNKIFNKSGLLSPIDESMFLIETSEKSFDPEKPLSQMESVFVSEEKLVDNDKKIKDIDDNIQMFQDLISSADEDDAEYYKDEIKKLNDEKKELLSEKKGGAKKLPKWAQQTFTETPMDYNLLSDKILLFFSEHITYILTLIHNNEYVLGNNDKNLILSEYKNLTNQTASLNRIRLILPQPVTLTKKYVDPMNPESIFLKYAVTEKADGERFILFIIKNNGILINSKKQMYDTGVIFTDLNRNYIFDGEYITKNIDGENIKLFMIFDIYLESSLDNKQILKHHKLPFYSETDNCRLNLINKFNDDILKNISFNKSSVEINVKTYQISKLSSSHEIGSEKYLNDCTTMLKHCDRILTKSEKSQITYNIDGLIFIPLFNPVKGENPNDTPNFIGGKWSINFKWKPPEENTIDFKVKFIKEKYKNKIVDKVFPYTITNEDGTSIMNKYKQLQLFVGYDSKQDDKIDFCMRILDDNVHKEKGNEILFNPDDERVLHTTNIPFDLESKKITCVKDKLEIKDNDIVEMRYVEKDNRMLWEPLRIRNDKTEPQFFTVANNVWSTIVNPISENLIRNKIDLNDVIMENKKENGNKYYVSNDNNPITNCLRKLHNYIKSKLIIGVCSSFKKKISILDLSIGRGGDMNKYLSYDSNAKFIMGVDQSENISECCERYFKNKKDKPPAVFLHADSSQNLSTADCFDGLSSDKMIKHSKNMLNILYNLKQPVPKEYKNIQKKYNNLGLKKFDVISSQFSLHYYFESKEKFEGFMNNVFENIAANGYFIGTCYNGEKVFRHLNDYGDLEFKDTNDTLIYSIKKMYDIDSLSTDPNDTDKIFGQKIDVFMESIGQTIPEYLVDFNFLRHYMEENGFKLISPDVKNRYKNLFKPNNINNGFGDFDKVIENLNELNDSDKDLQKGGQYEDSMDILKNTSRNDDGTIKKLGYEKLRLLSSFNNFFVFQKN